MEKTVSIHELDFEIFISSSQIQNEINELGQEITNAYEGKNPIFICVLNGAFLFMADLMRSCNIECEVTFIRLSSYEGTKSTGRVKSVVGLMENIEDRHIIIVEDIIDTGKTMNTLLPQLEAHRPASICITTLLDKPSARTEEVNINYRGFEIPNEFVVGYGLDYNGLGRNLPDIYKVKPSNT